MTWREDLRRVKIGGRNLVGGSFRGVPFFIESTENSGGRRTVTHEFPFRDDPYREDLGRKARTFRIDAYVVGDDYLDQRDKLLSALEDNEGPGELVHPYRGVLSAIAETYSWRTSRTEGGIATFAIEFAETPTQAPVPTDIVDGVDAVNTSADAAFKATKAELVEQYDTSGLPAFALASAESALTKASASLQAKLAPIVSGTQELAGLAGQVTILTAEASSLVRSPDTILDKFVAAISNLGDTIEAVPGAMLDALSKSYGADLGPFVSATTSTRERELSNQAALTAALRRVVAIEAARLAPVVPYESIEDALAARDAVAAMLEEQAGTAGDTAYPALVDLRSQVLQAVPGSSEFARVVTVTRPQPIPSLLLAYQLYGSVDLEADIIARNDISNPAFVAGDLKVLSDA